MLIMWCSLPKAYVGDDVEANVDWSTFWKSYLGQQCVKGRWLALHWKRSVCCVHSWKCWWVSLMLAADFLDMPDLYWGMMFMLHRNCEQINAKMYEILFNAESLDSDKNQGNCAQYCKCNNPQ